MGKKVKAIRVELVKDNSDEVLEALGDRVEEVLEMWGMKAEEYAKKKCPTDTGLLKNSITYAISGKPAAISAYAADNPRPGQKSAGSYRGKAPKKGHSVFVGTNVEYAPYVELGAGGHDPKHFLQNAVQGHTSTYKKILQQVLES